MHLVLISCLILVFSASVTTRYAVSYYLYKKEKLEESILLTSETFNQINVKNPTKIIVHGYFESVKNDWYKNMTSEYLRKGNFNIIQVDWSEPASNLYSVSSSNTRPVGYILGDFIVILHKYYGLVLRNVHLICHSLGAHVCGYAGKKVRSSLKNKIARITALDAAGPLFEFPISIMQGLSKNDADIVDAIHTDGGVFGRKQPTGTVDFYPNGGVALQPGCDTNLLPSLKLFSDLRDKIFCSHTKSHAYFINSINDVKYKGFKCKSWTSFVQNECTKSIVAIMGDNYEYGPELTGKFYLYAK